VVQVAENLIRVAGLMHEPENGEGVAMAGPMGMVKLFVRNGVQVVRDAYGAYQEKLAELGLSGKPLVVAIVHHANYKINKLKEKHLNNEGIDMPMPWLLTEFGNVSAASNMIAFLKQLPHMHPGDHVMIDGAPRPGMAKAIFQIRGKPGLSLPDFKKYWLGVHGPIVKKCPGLRRYVQCHAVEGAYAYGNPRWDGVAELWCDDAPAMERMFDSKEFREEAWPDAANFLDTISMFVAQEYQVI